MLIFSRKTPPELSQLISSPIQPYFYKTFICILNAILLILALFLFTAKNVCEHMNYEITLWWAGPSCFLSCGDGYVGELLELQQGPF